MKVLLTGATGYIGQRLRVALEDKGHEVIALVRNKQRYPHPGAIDGDLLRPEKLHSIPQDIDIAFYLVHSMGDTSHGFVEKEATCAENFAHALEKTKARQIIYLSGLCGSKEASEHMASRHNVAAILQKSSVPTTVLEAGIIIGSGSASFEIMRDLTEKLPAMVCPKWVSSKCQPIGIADVLFYLTAVMGNDACFNRVLQIGGPEQLSYREMMLKLAKLRGLTRFIIPIPVLTPYLSSLWLRFITRVNLSLAKSLIGSLKTDAVVTDHTIDTLIPHTCLTFEEAVGRAFDKIAQNAVVSSWRDAMSTSDFKGDIEQFVQVPVEGCLFYRCEGVFSAPRKNVVRKLWRIGGDRGWYTCNWLWRKRGEIDRLFGGAGLRRGRTHPDELNPGDALDFWRVIKADREEGHLILYAEMRLPGEAWLEWKIEDQNGRTHVLQKATFRPKGLFGRLYWYLFYPAHLVIFPMMCKAIGKGDAK